MNTEERHYLGEGWMWCRNCGAKLYSFDLGFNGITGDLDRSCPYLKNGKCQPDSVKRL